MEMVAAKKTTDWLKRSTPPVPDKIAELFETFTLMTIEAGRGHYSGRAIIERIRWHLDVDVYGFDDELPTPGDPGAEFKINDHWCPCLTRWFMQEHPEYSGFFELRRLRS